MDDSRLQVTSKQSCQLSGSEPETAADVVHLGAYLDARREELIRRASLLNEPGRLQLGPAADTGITRAIELSTDALIRLLASGGEETAHPARDETAGIFGELARQREAPLDEIAKRALRWREAAGEMVDEIADEHSVPPAARYQAHRMLQRWLGGMLLGLCEAFEGERAVLDDELVRRERELAFMATHDLLTGLPNRTLFIDRAEHLLARSRRTRQRYAALFIDLDGFKAVNDGLGHAAGDELLKAVAQQLKSTIRESDTLGRLAGDEFVILIEHLAEDAGPELVAERILEVLRQPFAIEGGDNDRLNITASIGIAMGGCTTAAELLRDADIAMYHAKVSGKNRYVIFEPGMQDAIHARIKLDMDLRDAVAKDEFYLVYQPMFDLDGLTPIRMEALLRWRRPEEKPMISPGEFVPVLEESGLIADVGSWVLREACSHCAEWLQDGLDIGVAVNVSAIQLEADSFVQDVSDALTESGIQPSMLTIEITETALMRDPERTAERLRAIKQLGVRLSIDDFGTGYSSLAYLQRFPVDELKIDRTFISQLDTAQRDALIRTFVQLGRALKIETIAEGIEDRAQLLSLQAEQCDIGQGFLFARPMEAGECRGFIERWPVARPPGMTPVSAAR